MLLWREPFRAFVAAGLMCRARAEADEFSTSLAAVYEPYLANLARDPSIFNPSLGGQDFGMCCQLAINESLYIVDGTLRKRPGQSFYRGDISILDQFPSFPCVAKFNGSLKGPHQDFWTPYRWCHDRCPGWTTTRADDFNSWLKPLVAFIFPSLIFCLNVPRRRRFELPSILFVERKTFMATVIWYSIKILLASLIVTIDTIVWLAVVFAMAGPLLVSGIYEAISDQRALRFLERQVETRQLTVQQRAHILLVILIGNLDLEPAWSHSKAFVSYLEPYSVRISNGVAAILSGGASQEVTMTASHLPVASTNPDAISKGRSNSSAHHLTEAVGPLDAAKTRLKAMLGAQYSFGGTTGAPVLFFVGSFVWTCFEIKSTYGNYSSAHQLAFGMMWTTIPHIAIVSSFLLAGNNPSVWEGIVPHLYGNSTVPARPNLGSGRLASRIRAPILDRFKNPYASMYPESLYKPAWMWNRGPNKAMWLARIAEEYGINKIHADIHGSQFGAHVWIAGFCAFVLIFIPVCFGILVSYTTPQVGFSCRSLTMLVYGTVQILLVILWLCDWCYWRRDARGKVMTSPDLSTKLLWSDGIWYICFVLCISLSVLTSIGGTCFVLMGLYTNCLCFIQAKYWWNRMVDPRAAIFWNSATYEQIYYAKRYWFPAGIVGTTFLTFVAYLGWWYQRSLRLRFHNLAEKVDHNAHQDIIQHKPVGLINNVLKSAIARRYSC